MRSFSTTSLHIIAQWSCAMPTALVQKILGTTSNSTYGTHFCGPASSLLLPKFRRGVYMAACEQVAYLVRFMKLFLVAHTKRRCYSLRLLAKPEEFVPDTAIQLMMNSRRWPRPEYLKNLADTTVLQNLCSYKESSSVACILKQASFSTEVLRTEAQRCYPFALQAPQNVCKASSCLQRTSKTSGRGMLSFVQAQARGLICNANVCSMGVALPAALKRCCY